MSGGEFHDEWCLLNGCRCGNCGPCAQMPECPTNPPAVAAPTGTDAYRVSLNLTTGDITTTPAHLPAASTGTSEGERSSRNVAMELIHEAEEATARAESAEAAYEALRADALGLLPDECWVTRRDVMRCTDMIGGGFESGPKWTEGMCCLPCRLRALLSGGEGRKA